MACMTSSPGRSHRWKVLPRMICAPMSFSDLRRHRLDRAIGAHRHEDRGLDHAVVQGQGAAAGGAVGGEQFKLHGLMWRLCNSCFLERCEIVEFAAFVSLKILPMRVALRFLVMVMLLTVLSPKFGWESVSAAQAHIHTAGMAHDEMAGHETHDGCHQHDAAVNDDMGDHHCCPGHVLGHLPGGVGTAPGLPQAGKSACSCRATTRFVSPRAPPKGSNARPELPPERGGLPVLSLIL